MVEKKNIDTGKKQKKLWTKNILHKDIKSIEK